MTRRERKTFYYFIKDFDQKLYNCIGPIWNDNEWNEEVVKCQKKGRNLRVSTARNKNQCNMLKEHLETKGLNYTKDLLVYEPVDKSKEFIGNLPAYAKDANRNRIVRLLCHSCSTTRFAEMNCTYPGQETLRKSQIFDFTAKCLECGHIEEDSYNWYR